MSKNIKTTALVLVLLLAFLCGFGLGKNRGFHLNINNNPYGTTAPADKTDAEPVDATTAPADTADDAPAKATKPLKAPKGTEAVVAAFNKAVNRTKRTESVTIEKATTLELQPGAVSPGLAKGAAQAALKNSLRPGTETVTVRPADGKKDAVTAKDALEPLGKAAKLDAGRVLAAKAKAKDGGYVIVIKLKEETASFDGEKTKQAKGHASCMTLPDPAQLQAFGVKVKAAKLQYTATAIRAEVNADGLLTKVQYTVPFSAGLMGKYFLMHLDAAVDGTYSETVTLSY